MTLRFGLIADVQYADKPDKGERRYRAALSVLERAVDAFSAADVDFVVHLGDLIDGQESLSASRADLERVLRLFEQLPMPVHHVLGNHCCDAGRDHVLLRSGAGSGYRVFHARGFRFIVLDGVAHSVCAYGEDDPRHWAARSFMAAASKELEPSNERFNGGLGVLQRNWLSEVLATPEAPEEKTVILCHQPALAAAGSPRHLLWDREQVLPLLPPSSVVAWIAGHDHQGGYGQRDGIHHLTLPGAVEAPLSGTCHALVSLSNFTLDLVGGGTVPSRKLSLR